MIHFFVATKGVLCLMPPCRGLYGLASSHWLPPWSTVVAWKETCQRKRFSDARLARHLEKSDVSGLFDHLLQSKTKDSTGENSQWRPE